MQHPPTRQSYGRYCGELSLVAAPAVGAVPARLYLKTLTASHPDEVTRKNELTGQHVRSFY